MTVVACSVSTYRTADLVFGSTHVLLRRDLVMSQLLLGGFLIISASVGLLLFAISWLVFIEYVVTWRIVWVNHFGHDLFS